MPTSLVLSDGRNFIVEESDDQVATEVNPAGVHFLEVTVDREKWWISVASVLRFTSAGS